MPFALPSVETLANEAPYSALAEVEESIQELQAGAARESLKYDLAKRPLNDAHCRSRIRDLTGLEP